MVSIWEHSYRNSKYPIYNIIIFVKYVKYLTSLFFLMLTLAASPSVGTNHNCPSINRLKARKNIRFGMVNRLRLFHRTSSITATTLCPLNNCEAKQKAVDYRLALRSNAGPLRFPVKPGHLKGVSKLGVSIPQPGGVPPGGL